MQAELVRSPEVALRRAQGASSGSAHILGLANLVKWLRGRVEIPCALLPQFSLLAFDITERRWAAFAAGDRLAYALMGHGNRYEFYVRRYANTLTWTHKLVIRDPADACHDQLALSA